MQREEANPRPFTARQLHSLWIEVEAPEHRLREVLVPRRIVAGERPEKTRDSHAEDREIGSHEAERQPHIDRGSPRIESEDRNSAGVRVTNPRRARVALTPPAGHRRTSLADE